MNFSHRFFLYGPFAMLVALAASVMVYWWIAATALVHKLDALNGQEIAPGVRMSFAAKRIAGFPFRLDAIFDNFALETADTHGPIVWRATNLASHTFTYANDLIVFEAAGQQEIDWTSDTRAKRKLVFTPGTLRASTIVSGGKLERLDLDINAFASAKLSAGRMQLHLRPDPVSDALDLAMDLRAVHFAGDAAAGFPDGLKAAHIEGRITPSAPFNAALSAKENWPEALENWRGGGGFLKVDNAAVDWRKCEATSSGNLALDEAHRLKGALAFTLEGCGDLEKQAKTVTAKARRHRAIVAVLAALAAAEQPDQSGALPVAIVFRGGVVFVGPGKSAATDSYFEPVWLLHALY